MRLLFINSVAQIGPSNRGVVRGVSLREIYTVVAKLLGPRTRRVKNVITMKWRAGYVVRRRR